MFLRSNGYNGLLVGFDKGGFVNYADIEHVFPDTASVNESGHLEIGGLDSCDVVQEYGSPVYIYCEETLRARCQAFRSAFVDRHPNSEVVYASKAYISPAIARVVREEGLGLDVVSGGELAVAQITEFPPESIYFHGNNKSVAELEQALDYQVGRIVVDNLMELEHIERLAETRGIQQTILLRITPGIDPHTHAHTTTGTLDSKFGLHIATGAADQAVIRALQYPHIRVAGIHFHLGSPIFELEPYAAAIKIAFEFASKYRDQGLEITEFSPGGGFAIAYTRDQSPPSPDQYAEVIVDSLTAACKVYQYEMPKLIVEPGRAITGPAGVAMYTVGIVKTVTGVRKFVSVDGGMGDNIRPALYDAKYEAVVANRMNDQYTELTTVAGKFCESGDILVKDVLLPDVVEGDMIALPAAGAYAPSMASNYNLNPRPPIVMIRNGHARLIRRRESVEDMLRCEQD